MLASLTIQPAQEELLLVVNVQGRAGQGGGFESSVVPSQPIGYSGYGRRRTYSGLCLGYELRASQHIALHYGSDADL